MSAFLDNLDKYSSLIIMFATLIYVYFTYRLTKETTKLRENETTPFISMYVKSDSILSLIVENIGKAPAYDIEITMDKKYGQYFSCGCDFRHKISFFSPNQQLKVGMDTFMNLEKLDFDHIPIKVKYRSKDGKWYEDSFRIEWKYLSGSSYSTDSLKEIKEAIKETAKELKEIHKTFKKKEYIVTQKLKILEFTYSDTDVYIIFSNGHIITLTLDEFSEKTDIKDIKKVFLEDGSLHDYQENLVHLADAIYDKLKQEETK